MSQQKKTVLIVDDNADMATMVRFNIEQLGLKTHCATNGDEALKVLASDRIDAMLLDVHMPGRNGLSVLEYTAQHYPGLPVVMLTAVAQIETAVKAIKLGAFDYLTKPIDLKRLNTTLKNALEVSNLRSEVTQLKEKLRQNELFADIVGDNSQLNDLYSTLDPVLQTDASVLLIGESGTGKELVARAIHRGSRFRNGPFIPVNCAALNSEMAGSLLFGHVRGAFPGAIEDHAGFFEQADGGTIFLDEIADMSEDIQARVLRVLEQRRVKQLGAEKDKPLNFRVIAASNRDLRSAVSEEQFRRDLYFRLEEYPIFLPPLRNRRADIPILAEHFLRDYCETNGVGEKHLSKEVLREMQCYSWPGNVRELKNVVRRAAIRTAGSLINEIPMTLTPASTIHHQRSQVRSWGDAEKDTIASAYQAADLNAAAAARILGISRATMYRKIKKLGLAELLED